MWTITTHLDLLPAALVLIHWLTGPCYWLPHLWDYLCHLGKMNGIKLSWRKVFGVKCNLQSECTEGHHWWGREVFQWGERPKRWESVGDPASPATLTAHVSYKTHNKLVSIKTAVVHKFHPNLFGCCTIPATLLVGVQTPNEVDELLGDEFLCHDQLQLVKVRPLLLWQDRYGLQIPASVRRPGRSVNMDLLVQRLNGPDQVKLQLLPELKRFYISPIKVISISCSIR